MTLFRPSLLLVSGLLLSACAQGPQTLYNWDQYQGVVYQHMQGDDTGVEAQIDALEKNQQEASAKGQAVPPGFHAHLGMLYAQLGKDAQTREQFETEKRLFPESAPFMNFLMSSKKGESQ
ncbi:DUF4810 domain-containing protein [Aeromonas caviae]|uniref:DUF4810 domain-containing protein n=1 Tax=Aeromonas TaxID=642 RepID=UPI00191ECA3B|nr:DUF4810 domain-containing protein [Aeromonas caviae]MBL0656374.1 DUF4810 domain-containing protein [Aeromonas caviae]MDH0360445.1 DUF4810 domain-containing protein [Aeromonas caviae]